MFIRKDAHIKKLKEELEIYKRREKLYKYIIKHLYKELLDNYKIIAKVAGVVDRESQDVEWQKEVR